MAQLSHGATDLLISGRAINSLIAQSYIKDNHDWIKNLIDHLLLVKGLVVYRASPSEKAELVKLVRKNKPKVTTLAIGDGANDVNMI